MTVDEELSALDDSMRRLKVEYDMYFGGGRKKPPADLDWRVQSLLKKYSDSRRMNFAQRFRYNSIAQRYSIFAELWRQKLRIKEEGYRRPEDAVLAIHGMRTSEERSAARALKGIDAPAEEPTGFVFDSGDLERETECMRGLYEAMLDAKRRNGEAIPDSQFDGFMAFIKLKTDQIRREFECERVEYRVEVKDRRVRLTGCPQE